MAQAPSQTSALRSCHQDSENDIQSAAREKVAGLLLRAIAFVEVLVVAVTGFAKAA